MTENLPSINLVPHENEIKTLSFIAKTAQNSGLYSGVGGEAKILMILLAAHELGIKPLLALNGGIWNIQGKIEISARLMNSMIRRAGHSITIKQCDSKICIIEGKRKDNGDCFTSAFSMEDANKAGLAARDVWRKYAEDMLYARAMSRLARRLFPDIIGTAYVEGEIRDSNVKPDVGDKQMDENHMIEDNPIEVPVEEVEDPCTESIQELCNQYADRDAKIIESFLIKMKEIRQKPMKEILEEFRNHEHFVNLFERYEKSIKINS
jgi:hypothetical protein